MRRIAHIRSVGGYLLMAGLASLACPGAASAVFFGSSTSYPVGSTPRDIEIGKFNGDARNDVATADAGGTISVLINEGNGLFSGPRTSDVSNGSQAFDAADFDNDGKLDLAVGTFGNRKLAIMRGNGKGRFQKVDSDDAGRFPAEVVARDFNRDGNPDVAVSTSRVVKVMLGDGSGEVRGIQRLSSERDGEDLIAGRIDGDSRLDLVRVNENVDEVAVFLGKADGRFEPSIDTATGNDNPESADMFDINDDRKLDLFVGGFAGGSPSILLGKGNGRFRQPVPVTYTHNSAGVAIGDLDRDGEEDVVVVTQCDDPNETLGVFPGLGGSSLGFAQDFDGGPCPTEVALGRLDGDGHPDAAIANQFDDLVTIQLETD